MYSGGFGNIWSHWSFGNNVMMTGSQSAWMNQSMGGYTPPHPQAVSSHHHVTNNNNNNNNTTGQIYYNAWSYPRPPRPPPPWLPLPPRVPPSSPPEPRHPQQHQRGAYLPNLKQTDKNNPSLYKNRNPESTQPIRSTTPAAVKDSEKGKSSSSMSSSPMSSSRMSSSSAITTCSSLLDAIRSRIPELHDSSSPTAADLAGSYALFETLFDPFLTHMEAPHKLFPALVFSVLKCVQDREFAMKISSFIWNKMMGPNTKPAQPCLKMRGLWLLGELLRPEYAPLMNHFFSLHFNIKNLLNIFFTQQIRSTYKSELQAIHNFWLQSAPNKEHAKLMKEMACRHQHCSRLKWDDDDTSSPAEVVVVTSSSCEKFYQSLHPVKSLRRESIPGCALGNFSAAMKLAKKVEDAYYLSATPPPPHGAPVPSLATLTRMMVVPPPPPSCSKEDTKAAASGKTKAANPNNKKTKKKKATPSSLLSPREISLQIMPLTRAADEKSSTQWMALSASSANMIGKSKNEHIKAALSTQLDDLLSTPPGPGVPAAVGKLLHSFLFYGNQESVSELLARQLVRRLETKDCGDPNKSVRILWVIGALHYSHNAERVKGAIATWTASNLANMFRRFVTKISEETRNELREIFRFWKTVMRPIVTHKISKWVSECGEDYSWLEQYQGNNNNAKKKVGVTEFYREQPLARRDYVDSEAGKRSEMLPAQDIPIEGSPEEDEWSDFSVETDSDPESVLDMNKRQKRPTGQPRLFKRVSLGGGDTTTSAVKRVKRNPRDDDDISKKGTGDGSSSNDESKQGAAASNLSKLEIFRQKVSQDEALVSIGWGSYSNNKSTRDGPENEFYLKNEFSVNDFVTCIFEASVKGWDIVQDETGAYRVKVVKKNKAFVQK